MLKRSLEAKIRQARTRCELLLARLEEMSEEEAEQWFHLLRQTEEDAERNGRAQGSRTPWRR